MTARTRRASGRPWGYTSETGIGVQTWSGKITGQRIEASGGTLR
jgi:hypothetical protein